MSRPVEIVKLIKWLRKPGRSLPCGYGTAQHPCPVHKLEQLCGGPFPGGSFIAQELSRRISGMTDAILARVGEIADETRDPLKVAAYLEAEFSS